MEAAAQTPLELNAIERLDTASDWLVRYGAFVLSNRDVAYLKDKLHIDGPVILWVQPLLDENDTLVQFRIKTSDYNYDIEALHRAEIGGQTYEYWMVQTSAQDWATPLNKCKFYITTLQKDGKRAILKKSTTYISKFETPNGAFFKFPEDDINKLYKLKAWLFPHCFPDSQLPNRKM